jgi:hypothetical protein
MPGPGTRGTRSVKVDPSSSHAVHFSNRESFPIASSRVEPVIAPNAAFIPRGSGAKCNRNVFPTHSYRTRSRIVEMIEMTPLEGQRAMMWTAVICVNQKNRSGSAIREFPNNKLRRMVASFGDIVRFVLRDLSFPRKTRTVPEIL